MDFPFREYRDDELTEEFLRLRNARLELKRSNVGYKCSNAFFQEERMNSSSLTKLNGLDFWRANKEYIKEYARSKNRTDLFTVIQFLNHIPSQFPPSVAAYLYVRFRARHVLDPFAGWGDRCLAAMALNIDYTGIDSNLDLAPCFRSMVNYYPHDSSVSMFFDSFENVDTATLDFDFVLSSPPFWELSGALSEVYEHMPNKDYSSFIRLFGKFIKRYRKKAVCCFYMPKHMAEDLEVKYSGRMEYTGIGNKKVQVYSIYIYTLQSGRSS
jgi:hypothetical protein